MGLYVLGLPQPLIAKRILASGFPVMPCYESDLANNAGKNKHTKKPGYQKSFQENLIFEETAVQATQVTFHMVT